MSDSPYDPYNAPPPPPEGFDVPERPQYEEPPPATDFTPEAPPVMAETMPVMGDQVPAMADGVPLMGDAVPAMAGGLIAVPPDPRVAVDSRSALPGRIADEFVAWLKTLASAAVYATLIVTFGFQVARVEGQSMAPTLSDQDRLIVNKAAYKIGDPQIGDIVMLYYPNKPEKSFVKRVIAQEGDQVRIVAGKVYRNDVLMDDSFVPPEYRSHDDWGPEVIPEGYYFVMGDHRNNSSDSRHWGYVPKKYIIGKVQLRWWPVPEARVF
jgi:signal peptidase I